MCSWHEPIYTRPPPTFPSQLASILNQAKSQCRGKWLASCWQDQYYSGFVVNGGSVGNWRLHIQLMAKCSLACNPVHVCHTPQSDKQSRAMKQRYWDYICVCWMESLHWLKSGLSVSANWYTSYTVQCRGHLSWPTTSTPKSGFEWHLDFQKHLRGWLEIAIVLLSAICHLEVMLIIISSHKYNSLRFHSLSIAPKTSDSVSSAKLFPFQRAFWGPHEHTRESK